MMKRLIQVASATGRVTFLEIIRDKVLYNIILCAGLLLTLGLLASRLTFTRQDRLLLNFGLSALSISCAMIAIFTGSTLIGREFDRRTVYMALSRPVSRFQFVVGKYVGLGAVIAVNWAGLAASLSLIFLLALGVAAPAGTGGTLLAALALILAQSLVLSALSVFFSSFTTTSLAAMFTLGLYLVGVNVSQIRLIAAKLESSSLSGLLNGMASLLPNFEHFNLGTQVSYGIPLAGAAFAGALAYAVLWITLCLVGAGLLIQRRES